MRIIINIILFLIMCALVYVLVASIKDPIAFQRTFEERENTVKQKLKDHRAAQEAYKEITGRFAKSHDSLKYVLLNDSFEIKRQYGDADAVDGEAKVSISYVMAKDSMARFYDVSEDQLPTVLEELRYVPFTEKKDTFKMAADTMTYQNILVNVIHTHTDYNTFMKEFNNDKYRRYDSNFDPDKSIGYGDMNRPTTNGSW